MVLLLDAFNEMPAASEREFRERVGWWKDWLVRMSQARPGNRVIFSCRTLDYSAPLSTPALRVPQVQIESLSDEQVHEFLRLYSPLRGEAIWTAIAGTPQLEALRAPFFLALLVDQVEATGELAEDRAGLFTSFVRQALKREVERNNPLFALEELLANRDLRRIAEWQWRDVYELPERGVLVPRLAGLAYGMQVGHADGGASQVRVDYDTALDLVDDPHDETIVKAGVAISVLDEDPAADEVLYRHQLLQEYFAARVLAREPRHELVASPWRIAEIQPGLREILETLPAAETLPPLATTGWEETTILAAAMVGEPEPFLRNVMPHNLVVAGRAARLPAVRDRLSAAFLDELRWALVGRSRDPEADLRHRIACGYAVGDLGDPRWERKTGPDGSFLAPPLIRIETGAFPVGLDKPIGHGSHRYLGQIPGHTIHLGAFLIGQFPVTNAEYACFIGSGGYDDWRWWDTPDAAAWRAGRGTEAGRRANVKYWWRRYQGEPERLEQSYREGLHADRVYETWQQRLQMSERELDAHLLEAYPDRRLAEPGEWRNGLFNCPSQPVVGVCWYEARAYCLWLAAQTGEPYRLPSEVEWEAAARGPEGRRYAFGETLDPLRANIRGTRVRRTTPVGVFPEGATPAGAMDMTGNVVEWTSSLFGTVDDEPTFRYPYDPDDGREDPAAPADVLRVGRGGSWRSQDSVLVSAYRGDNRPSYRGYNRGFRVARSA